MSWSRERSRKRIQTALESAPKTSITLRRFDQFNLQARREEIRQAHAQYNRSEDLIFNVGRNQAVLVEGVHVYLQLIDYHDAVSDSGHETERAHRRLLQMLHTHYSMGDFIAEDFEAQRVDYHGPRMHTVIVTPTGPDQAYERARRALAFAQSLRNAIERASQELDIEGLVNTRVRIGIDSGPAVAVNSGRGSEPEPLFLGNPANYAAKLAAGDTPGIYISDRVRRDLGAAPIASHLSNPLDVERQWDQTAGYDFSRVTRRLLADIPDVGNISNGALQRMQAFSRSSAGNPTFNFRQFTPPLRGIRFEDLAPANSIRMGLVSLFADLSGFTDYVARSIQGGQIEQMVSNLHVIRAEMAATVREDFEGRKIRFIGDCIHAEFAEGTAQNVDVRASVNQAVEAAAGLRSGFELCKQMLPGIGALGLAIGLDFGETPITRLGIRGMRSVRCSTSRAVSQSEAEQERCGDTQTAIGEEAYRGAPLPLQTLFGPRRIVSGLDYAAFAMGTSSANKVSHGHEEAEAVPHGAPRR